MDTSIKAFFAYFYLTAGNSISNIWIAQIKFKNEKIGDEYLTKYDIFEDNDGKKTEKIEFVERVVKTRLNVLKEIGFDAYISEENDISELLENEFNSKEFAKFISRYRHFLADDPENFNEGVKKILDEYEQTPNKILLRIHLLIILMISDYHLEIYIKKLNKLIQETNQLDTFKGPFIIPKEERNKPDKDGNKINWSSIQKELEQFKDPLNKREIEGNTTLEIDESDWKKYRESINPNYENKLIDKYVQVRSVTNESVTNENDLIPKEVQIYDLLIEILKSENLLNNDEYKTLIKNNTKGQLKKHKGKLLFKEFDSIENGIPKNLKFVLSQELMFAAILLNGRKDKKSKITINSIFKSYKKNLDRLEGIRELNNRKFAPRNVKEIPNRDNFYQNESYSRENPEELVAYEGNDDYEGYNFNELYRKAVKNITRLGVSLNNIQDKEKEKNIIEESKKIVTETYINPSSEKLNDLIKYFQINTKLIIGEKRLTKNILIDLNRKIIMEIHHEVDDEIFFKFKKRALKPQKREKHSNLVTINAAQLYKIFEMSKANMNRVKGLKSQIQHLLNATNVEAANHQKIQEAKKSIKKELEKNKVSYSNIFEDYSGINFNVSGKFNKPYLNISKAIVEYCQNKYDDIQKNTEKYDIYGYISKSQYRISNKNVIESINENKLAEIKSTFDESSPNQVNAYIEVIEIILKQKWHSIPSSKGELTAIKEYRNKIMHLDLFKYTENEVVEGFNRQELEDLINQELARKKSKQDTNYQIEFYRNKRFGNLFKIKNNGE